MPVNLRVLRKHIKISPRETETVRKFPPGGERTNDLLHARLLRIPLDQLGLHKVLYILIVSTKTQKICSIHIF